MITCWIYKRFMLVFAYPAKTPAEGLLGFLQFLSNLFALGNIKNDVIGFLAGQPQNFLGLLSLGDLLHKKLSHCLIPADTEIYKESPLESGEKHCDEV